MGADSALTSQSSWVERVFCVLGTRSEGLDALCPLGAQHVARTRGLRHRLRGCAGISVRRGHAGRFERGDCCKFGALGRPPETEIRDQSWTLKLPSEAGKQSVFLSIWVMSRWRLILGYSEAGDTGRNREVKMPAHVLCCLWDLVLLTDSVMSSDVISVAHMWKAS